MPRRSVTNATLDRLIAHECAYFGFLAELVVTDSAWFLTCGSLPDYWDANRALRPRDDGRGPELALREAAARMRAKGLRPVVDLDPVAMSQGFVQAAERLGMVRAPGSWLLMRYGGADPPEAAVPQSFRVIRPETADEAQGWIEVAASDNAEGREADLWRAVAEREAKSGYNLYLGMLRGVPVSCCDLFRADGWGRIESVATLPEYRRRGFASAVVAAAGRDSVEGGDEATWLFTEAGGAGERVYRGLGFTVRAVDLFPRFVGR